MVLECHEVPHRRRLWHRGEKERLRVRHDFERVAGCAFGMHFERLVVAQEMEQGLLDGVELVIDEQCCVLKPVGGAFVAGPAHDLSTLVQA